MENIIDVIVPKYKESEEVIGRLLDSIAAQEIIPLDKVGVIIVDDYSNEPLSDLFIAKYPKLNITRLYNDTNLGPGLSRQKGLDYSTATYVTFYDADDEINGKKTLAGVCRYMIEGEVNVLVTGVTEELFLNGNKGYNNYTPNKIAGLHGLFFNREYLVNNGYRFHKNLWHCEDSYFYRIVTYTSKIEAVNLSTYLWHFNQDSIVRKKREYDYNVVSFSDHILQVKDTYKFVMEKGCRFGEQFINSYLINAIYGLYIILASSAFDKPELQVDRINYEKEVYNMYIENKAAFDSINEVERNLMFFDEMKELARTNIGLDVNCDFYKWVESFGKAN